MICRNCGNEMRPDARFCPHCGAVNGESPGAGVYAGPEAPISGGRKKKTGLVIGAAAATAAVIAVAAFVLLGGLFGSPKGQVEKALIKSAAAYAAAEKRLGLPDTGEWEQDRAVSQTMDLELKSVNGELVGYDLSALEGLGLGLSMDYSGADRWLAYGLRAFWGEEELLGLWFKADDDELYFNSPQITGQTCYGVNTETLGADLKAMDSEGAGELEDVSFNLFDLMDTVLDSMDEGKLEKTAEEANRALWEAVKVKKMGGRTLSINGTETKTDAYRVIIPQKDLEDYVSAMEELMSTADYLAVYEELMAYMGVPQEEIDDLVEELKELELYGELADALRELIRETGDLELEVCLSGGYISAVRYEDEIWNEDVELTVYLGGGEEYVDDLGIEIETEGVKVTVSSSGDHGLKNGVYTDETSIRFRQNGVNLARVTSELRYDPKSGDDNFQWGLDVNSSGLLLLSLKTEGCLLAEDRQISLSLEDITLGSMGTDICSLAFRWTVSGRAERTSIENPRLVTRMTEEELMEMVLDTQQNVLDWSNEMEQLFLSRLPAELLYDMMY